MTAALLSQQSNCRNCYKCIRHCPVKAIRFSGNQASILEDACILCGRCYNVCPQDAKIIRDDLERARVLLAGDAPVIASIAPSFVAYYPGMTITGMNHALRRLGFAFAAETAAGAALVAGQFDALLRKRGGKPLISSCCPAVNLLIQKYHPGALPFLARVATPAQAHGRMLKAQTPGSRVVFIGPCIAKKSEADAPGQDVDLALTFEDLDRWLQSEGIALEPMADSPDQGGRSRFFPTTGGILKTMARDTDYAYLTIEGMENCVEALEELAEGGMEGRFEGCFIEMSACVGSCVGGPLIVRQKRQPVHGYLAIHRYARDVDDAVPPMDGLAQGYAYLGAVEPHPGEEELRGILRQMGKNSPEDELNCGSCGYNTCREKAVAVYQGKANYAMCLPFLKEKAESFSDNIISNTPNGILVLNESLEVQQINRSALQLLNLANASLVMGSPVVRILDPAPFLEALEKKRGMRERKVYLAEYAKCVEQTILYDQSYHILICLMRDVTAEEAARERREELNRKTIQTADQVVEKQMRIVQEIASLLGETTAETKIALTQLKESLADE